MAFQTFTTFSFTDEGASWDVELGLDGGTSTTNTTPVTDLVRRVGDPQLNPLEPILKASLDVSLFDKGRVVSSRIRNNAMSDIQVTVKRDGTIWHRGILQSVNGGDVIRYDNPGLQLTFDDGTSQLQSKGASDSKADLLQTVDSALGVSGSDLPVRVALAFNDTKQDLTIPRAQGQQIVGEQVLDDGTIFEALERVLRYYNLQMFQEGGKWRCLQRSYRDSGQSYEWAEQDGVTVTSGTRNPTNSFSDTDWFAPSGARKESLVRSVKVPPVGWSRSLSRREEELSFSTTLIAGGSISRLETWSTVAVGQSGSDDTFQLKLEGTADILDTNESGTFDVDIGQLMAVDPDLGDRYYWNTGNQTWTTTPTQITLTLSEATADTTVSWSLTEDITTQPGFGGFIIEVEFIPPPTDPDGDGLNELDSVSVDKALLQDLTENTDANVRPSDRVTLRTNGPGRQISEELGISVASAGGSLWPHGGLFFKDSSSGDFVIQHFDSDAEHATRAIGGANVGLDELRLRDRLAQTLTSMRRIEGLVGSTKVKLRDTIQYDGSDFLLVYSKHRVGDGVKEVAALELLNESLPSTPVLTEES